MISHLVDHRCYSHSKSYLIEGSLRSFLGLSDAFADLLERSGNALLLFDKRFEETIPNLPGEYVSCDQGYRLTPLDSCRRYWREIWRDTTYAESSVCVLVRDRHTPYTNAVEDMRQHIDSFSERLGVIEETSQDNDFIRKTGEPALLVWAYEARGFWLVERISITASDEFMGLARSILDLFGVRQRLGFLRSLKYLFCSRSTVGLPGLDISPQDESRGS